MILMSEKTVGFEVIELALLGFLTVTAFGFVSGADGVTGSAVSDSDVAPDFSFTLFNGDEFSLSEHVGQAHRGQLLGVVVSSVQ